MDLLLSGHLDNRINLERSLLLPLVNYLREYKGLKVVDKFTILIFVLF